MTYDKKEAMLTHSLLNVNSKIKFDYTHYKDNKSF